MTATLEDTGDWGRRSLAKPGRAFLALGLLWLMLLGPAGCGREPPRLPQLAPDAVVLAFGDSLTHGSGAGQGESYPDQLARLIHRRVVNAGRPGELSAEGRERLPGVLDRVHPDLLILCHGGNDMLRRQSMDALAANLRAMIGAARSRGIPVVLVGVPKPALFGLQSAGVYREVAEATGVPLEDEALAELEGDRSLKSDRIHLNGEGYARLAQAIAGLLRARGAL